MANRLKSKITAERKEELRLQREADNKAYLEVKASKNKTTNELIAVLQERLVQCCIDFINENNLGDLERVDFNADGLLYSAKCGEWTPATDSSICGSELVEENGWLVEKPFVNYC